MNPSFLFLQQTGFPSASQDPPTSFPAPGQGFGGKRADLGLSIVPHEFAGGTGAGGPASQPPAAPPALPGARCGCRRINSA